MGCAPRTVTVGGQQLHRIVCDDNTPCAPLIVDNQLYTCPAPVTPPATGCEPRNITENGQELYRMVCDDNTPCAPLIVNSRLYTCATPAITPQPSTPPRPGTIPETESGDLDPRSLLELVARMTPQELLSNPPTSRSQEVSYAQFIGAVSAAYMHRMGNPEAPRMSLDADLGVFISFGQVSPHGTRLEGVEIAATGGVEIQPEGGVSFAAGSGDAFHVGGRLTVLSDISRRGLFLGFFVHPFATWLDGGDTTQFECAFGMRGELHLESATLALAVMVGLNIADHRGHFLGVRFGSGFALP